MRAAAAFALTLLLALPAGAEDAAPTPEDADAARIDAATRDYERRLGGSLVTARRGAFVVRGDGDRTDLESLAEACVATLESFASTMGCRPDAVLPEAAKGEPARVEVFQFREERGYLAFLDKVFARIRDETVDDRRLALMRRQRGFFALSPRPIVAQYQGPSEMATVRSQVVHKTSHVLLLSHRPAGAWMPWWFLEGFGAWQEHRVLRESRTYCIEVERPGDYARAGTPEADEAAKARLETAWRERARDLVAARRHRDLATLSRLALNELVFDDVVQSWSVVDWLHRRRKLATFVTAYKDGRTFAKACETALGASPAAAEAQWRTWLVE